MFGTASVVGAQALAPNEPGFQPNRDYLALLPWESIDTSNNNVILSFTDLVLPGNGGRQLRFERVFTNVVAPGENQVGPQWRFGISGVPMRVTERPYITAPILPRGNIDAERNTTPYFWMLDGSSLKTTYVVPPDPANSSTLANVRTHDFWFYHRPSRTLSIPDGTVAQYDAQGRLTTIRDVFDANDTNIVSLRWLTNQQQMVIGLEVTQSLGNNQSRLVVIQLDSASGLPTEMTYNGKTWTYRYNARGLLEEVELPLGPGGPRWNFAYSTEQFSVDKVVRVTTPQGGVVSYEYADREFHFSGGTPAIFNVLHLRRAYDHDDRLLGEWKFLHFANQAGGNDVTEVTLPSQTKVTYQYGSYPDPNALAGTWQLRFRFVQTPGGAQIEREERQYTSAVLPAARLEEPWGVPRLAKRLVTRAGQTYTTDYSYSASTLPYFHEFHKPITITERGPAGSIERTTRWTYQHVIDEAYLLGLPASEAVTVNGMTLAKSWGYNSATGFRQSETRYGITTTFGGDDFGNVASVVKGNGKATSITYSWGVVKNTTTPGVTVERAINPDGTVASETVAGRTTVYEYGDPLGRRTRIQPPGPSSATTITYDDANRTMSTHRGSSVLTTTFDGFGRPVQTINAAGVKTRTEYDAESRTTYRSYAFTNADIGTDFTYDSLGRLTAEVKPDGTKRIREYDDATNSVTVQDEEGRSTQYTYRGFGHPDDVRLARVVDANLQEWTYSYDAAGNLAQVVAPTGHTRTWQRNTSGLLTSETHPESGTVQHTHYDAAGVLKRKVDARGAEFVYEHDDNDRVTRITSGTRITNIGYELGSNNRASISNGSVSTSFIYDAAGRLAARHDVIGAYVFDSRYEYDGNDQLVAIAYPTGRVVKYERNDPEGRITRVFETASGRDYAFGMSYHPSGALESYTAGNKIATAISHDPARYWVRSINAGPLGLTYSDYDDAGNIRTIRDSRGSAWDQHFTYDALHRLATAAGPWGSTVYAYDSHGNRQTTSSSTYSYDPGTLRLTAQNGVPFGYDNNGNLTSASTATYTYTPENWLATATDSGRQASYTYDVDGWRAKRAITGETTLFLRGPGGELLTEWHDLGATARARDYVYAGTRLIGAIDKPVISTACGGAAIPDGSPRSLTVVPGETVVFTFEGSACRKVSASITASTLEGCSHSYHSFRILNPNGSVLASFNGLCAGDIVGPVTLPTSGTYRVAVYSYPPFAGTVTVAVHDVVDLTGPISFGQAVNATLGTPGQRGVWTFTGTVARRVSVAVNASNLLHCGFYNWFGILKPDGSTLGFGGDICSGTIIGPFVLPATGTYTLIVDPYKSATPQMAVTVYDVVDVTGPIALNGSPLTAALNTPGQRALWTFSGKANQRVSTVVAATTVSQCGIYNSFGFLKPDGTALQTQWDMCTGAIVGPVTLPTDGTYTVLVDLVGSQTGSVMVNAYDVVDITGPVTVNGPAVTGTFTLPGQRGRWSFNGTAGQKVRAVVNASTVANCGLYNSFGILKPDGSALGTQWDMCAGAFTPQLTLPADGNYTLLVDPAGSQTGSVTARVIDPVVMVNRTAPPKGITVGASKAVSVQVVGGPGNARDTVRLSVVGSNGSFYLVSKSVPTSGSAVTFTMPSTPGTYHFRLFANDWTWIATSTTVTVK